MTYASNQTGTCGVCGREYKVRGSAVSEHGYTRPGDGWLHGRCFGAQRTAWELSPSTAIDFIARAKERISQLSTKVEDVDAGRVTSVQVRQSRGKEETVSSGDQWFTLHLAKFRDHLLRERTMLTGMVTELEEKVRMWKPGTLRAVSLPVLPFPVKDDEVVVARHQRFQKWNRRFTYGWEVWDGRVWVRVAGDTVKALVRAGKARWLKFGETLSAS